MNPQLSATTFKDIRNLPYGLGSLSIRNDPQPRQAESTMSRSLGISNLPGEKELAAEIERTQAMLQDRKRLSLVSAIAPAAKKGAKKETP
jgi:hypothetical protein